MVHKGVNADEDSQKKLVLLAMAALTEYEDSSVSSRKTSCSGNHADVVVEPFPALPINVPIPTPRKSSVQHLTQSTTDILKQDVTPPADRLKPWGNLEVLPDTEATAALAQLALNDRETAHPDVNKKRFVPSKRKLKRSTSLEWSEKLFQVRPKPKLRFISCTNCQALTTKVRDMNQAKEDLKLDSATLQKRAICRCVNEKSVQEDAAEAPKDDVPKHGAGAGFGENGSASTTGTPSEVNVRQPLMLLPPPVAAVEHQVCMRKLTPMPRDLPPSHQAKTIRYALFEPLNWIYDSCLTDQEFEEKWAAIYEAYNRFQHVPSKPVPPPSPQTQPPPTSCGRRHSFDKSIGFAKRTFNRTANYFVQRLRDRVNWFHADSSDRLIPIYG